MAKNSFFCVDGHTCGNPVRLVAGGGPKLNGATMLEKRAHFLAEFDWIRTGLMFEPRGHDIMSGSILYDPTSDDYDVAVLFIETSGCLPMCGHGTIGTVTMAIEEGLVTPKVPGRLSLETPAGLVIAEYKQVGDYVESVKLTNVPSFLYKTDIEVDCPDLGPIKVDVAYGGNFYAIVDPQENFSDMAEFTAGDLQRISPELRRRLNAENEFIHPLHPDIKGLSHIQWTGKPTQPNSTHRNAVFYGDKGIDRSPCGTGSSARLAQLVAKGLWDPADELVHESIIGSQFRVSVVEKTKVGDYDAVVPGIEGWARKHGYNTIFIDDRDPYAHGFIVT